MRPVLRSDASASPSAVAEGTADVVVDVVPRSGTRDPAASLKLPPPPDSVRLRPPARGFMEGQAKYGERGRGIVLWANAQLHAPRGPGDAISFSDA